MPCVTKAEYFAYEAKLLRRDLRNGSYSEADLPEVIAGIWRDDEDELRRAYGIDSHAELKSGVMAALPTKRAAKKAKKKFAKKTAKKVKRKSRAWWQLW